MIHEARLEGNRWGREFSRGKSKILRVSLRDFVDCFLNFLCVLHSPQELPVFLE